LSDDYKTLQGVWEFVKAEQHGKVLPNCPLKTLTIRGDSFTSVPPTPHDYRFALAFGGVMRVTTRRAGIIITSYDMLYRVRGDVLQFLSVVPTPRRFATTADGNEVMSTWRRIKPAPGRR
jgi:hypothetical protein